MWGGGGNVSAPTTPQSFGGIGSGMSGAVSPGSEAASIDLSDEEFDELLSESSQTKMNSPADDLLSAFQDDEEEMDTEDSIVEYSFPEDDSEGDENEINPAKVFEIVQPEVESNQPEVLDRTVRSNCSNCGKMFEVDLPEGVDRARTACPHCGSIESIALNE
jgi:ribosomal protein S27AE